ncbi:hypothetical protein DEO72_LG5g2203 [Vigna unguiculata]|uniref:Uncharacterized protein n=1 Tax=Vigna unguiculata TaxID=3917 RepID=A0A4D6M256_VIGUN|nr:hypothetical protein DEO72_LG5g2203 [Vigna unguiculata]
MLSPKRACLTQARLVETGQVHTSAIAQVQSSCLSEGGIAQARRARLSENTRNQQPSLLAVSPKRGPIA